MGEGVGEIFFFFEAGVGVSSSAAGVRFFFGDVVGAGVADSSCFPVGEDFFFGDGLGVGVGDFFFAAVAVFFLRCGVGVGVEKIFFSVCPSDCSAASLAETAAMMHVNKMKTRRSIG